MSKATNGVRNAWQSRPYPGLAWRPHDLPDAIFAIAFMAVIVGFMLGEAPLFVSALFIAVAAYLLLLRHFHDAYLRRRISYRVSGEHLEVWIDGEAAPRCKFQLTSLASVHPQFVRPSGHGTIELPPGGWAAQPRWVNNWNNLVPAAFPCRRLELIPDVKEAAAMLRSLGARAKLRGSA